MNPESVQPDPHLIADGLTVRYGGISAVNGVSLSLAAGEVVALLGANGAGKSSSMAALVGASKGEASVTLHVFGKRAVRPRPHALARMGVVFIPAGGAVFAQLSVLDNLLIGGYALGSRRTSAPVIDEVFDLFPILAERREQTAGLLSGGEQRMLAFGRAMMCRPRVMLMDEPSLGLAPIIVDRIMQSIQAINQRGTSVLLAEQNAVAALKISTRAYVMERGRIVRTGPSDELAADPAVADIFLGLADGADRPQAGLDTPATISPRRSGVPEELGQ